MDPKEFGIEFDQERPRPVATKARKWVRRSTTAHDPSPEKRKRIVPPPSPGTEVVGFHFIISCLSPH